MLLNPHVNDPRLKGSGLSIRRAVPEWDVPHPELGRETQFRVMGVDLGQAADHSAASVISRRHANKDFIGPPDRDIVLERVRRYPTNVDYYLICENLLSYPGLDMMLVEYNGVGRPVYEILLKMASDSHSRVRLIPVLTAASRTRAHELVETSGRRVYHVPKIDLVSALTLLIQSGRFVVPAGLDRSFGTVKRRSKVKVRTASRAGIEEQQDDADERPPIRTNDSIAALLEEMRQFQIRYTASANVQFGNAPGRGKHDDMVISTCLAAWWITRPGSGTREPGIHVP